MAKFCTKCGKKLEEGEVCNCQETSEVLEDVTAAQPITPTVGAFDYFGSILKGSFTNPVSTIKNYNTDSNLIISIIFMAVCSLASGLFVYCLMNSLSSMLAGLFSGFSMLSTSSLSGLNVDFAPVFFKSFFFVAIYFVTLAGMITLMGKVIFKADTNFKKILTAVGLSSVIMICALILGAIFSYVKFGLAFVFLIVGVIFGIIYLAFATSESLNVTKDKVAYALVPSIAVALFVMLYILPKIFS